MASGGLAACGPEERPTLVPEGHPPLGPAATTIPADVKQLLEDATDAYRDRDFEASRDFYRRAAELTPHLAAAWFGVHLAERALGNDEAAEAALRRARALDPVAGDHPRGPPGTNAPGGSAPPRPVPPTSSS